MGICVNKKLPFFVGTDTPPGNALLQICARVGNAWLHICARVGFKGLAIN
jgi:hypothetical protein